jgi:hypothetical protein
VSSGAGSSGGLNGCLVGLGEVLIHGFAPVQRRKQAGTVRLSGRRRGRGRRGGHRRRPGGTPAAGVGRVLAGEPLCDGGRTTRCARMTSACVLANWRRRSQGCNRCLASLTGLSGAHRATVAKVVQQMEAEEQTPEAWHRMRRPLRLPSVLLTPVLNTFAQRSMLWAARPAPVADWDVRAEGCW